ncbi:2-oxo-4-hydroxy-4-carboxy-5-ureidoimidazoline decarboxylase [Roseomonas nepalensis]|uniref:2-oxo-4-hydroxy-4-carboxy-5-ureidoimidazoline decarboxylase n=1 Tax=Muricoccus nepalensis TaxID=1854500 RepID=A0A502GFE0_9PROT|nr:2-oxo-4-hydroxy-4-carboxy-5-ureidoimidazoline decarboxylase [Roseomonas nepalensis]TPG60322.1 2-oxo-4-hydroxy-4-carboxy-5-ureidoimidazoline decarboxylase [Roseomonas nepalensis]
MGDGQAAGPVPRPDLAALNALPAEGFAAALDGVFEHAPWVARRAAASRPFASTAALHAALMAVVRGEDEAGRVRFLNLHPELTAGALPPDMTAASREEQGGAGLEDAGELRRLNAAYRARHGIPFMICLRRHTGPDVLRRFRARLGNPVAVERAAALEEVAHVSRLRLAARVAAPDAEPPRGRIVLAAAGADGTPFAGLALALRIEGAPAGEWTTDAEGRAGPLLAGETMRIGRYTVVADGEAIPFAVEDPAAPLALRLSRAAAGWRLAT